jgi:phosphoglucosamine mutase
MKKKYFGTDGIRGRVGETPITPEFMLRLGWACGRVFSERSSEKVSVIIGKDTRVSGYMFESALEAGLVAAGANVKLLGPLPTPAIAMMTRSQNAAVGIVISASHNPYYDNGIKFFSGLGAKLSDELELAIEAALDISMQTVDSAQLGKATRLSDAAGRYIEFCKATLPGQYTLKGLNFVLDCAHGATYNVAPAVFRELGANVTVIGAEPDGFNINEGVGSTATELLSQQVVETGANFGIAFDGDGDRVLFVDADGSLVDGDGLLYVLAMHRLAVGQSDPGVVGTQMSNMGLEIALGEQGVQLARTKVGDRYVRERMAAEGWQLGGESSGHLICGDVTTTGDGIVAALQVLKAIVASGRSLSDLLSGMKRLPQVMINVPLPETSLDLAGDNPVSAICREVESALEGRGRLLLRPSGTEPVIRVMVEGDDAVEIKQLAEQVADVIRCA